MSSPTFLLLFLELAAIERCLAATDGSKTVAEHSRAAATSTVAEGRKTAGTASSVAEGSKTVMRASRYKGRSVKCKHKSEDAANKSAVGSKPAASDRPPTSTFPPDVDESNELQSTTLAPSYRLEGQVKASMTHKTNATQGLFDVPMASTSQKSSLTTLLSILDHDSDGALSVHELQAVLDTCSTCWTAFDAFAKAVHANTAKEQNLSEAVEDQHPVHERLATQQVPHSAAQTQESAGQQSLVQIEQVVHVSNHARSADENTHQQHTDIQTGVLTTKQMPVENSDTHAEPKAQPISGTSKNDTNTSDELSPAPLQYREIHVDNFNARVRDSNFVWMLEFYSAMCGACQQFQPTFDELSKKLNAKVLIGKVNIDERVGLKLAQDLGVLQHGVPTIRLYTAPGNEGQSVLNGISLLDGVEPTADGLLKISLDHLQGLSAHGGKLLKIGASSSVPHSSTLATPPTSSAFKAPRNKWSTVASSEDSDFVRLR